MLLQSTDPQNPLRLLLPKDAAVRRPEIELGSQRFQTEIYGTLKPIKPLKPTGNRPERMNTPARHKART